VIAAAGASALLITGGALAYIRVAPRPAPPDIAMETRPVSSPAAALAPAAAATPRPDDPSIKALAREQGLRAFQEGLAAGGASGEPALPSPAPDPPPEIETAGPPTPAAAPSIDGVRVLVYTASWCSVCKRAKAWMDSQGIAYEERDIEASSEDARTNRALNPRGSIPTFDVEGDVLVGFSESSLLATMRRAVQRRAARSY
jgi:glutaredoxin